LLLAGVQKGFAPAAPGNTDSQEEESWNYEFGTRFNSGQLHGEIIGFYSDYSNMHGNCTASQGCDEDLIGNQYNAGEVDIKGLEVSLGYDAKAGSFDMPLSLAYTYSDSEFQSDFNSAFSIWGDVVAGDEIPYIPEQQLQLKMGLNNDQWDFSLSMRYMSELRVTAGKGTIASSDKVNSRTVWDLSAKYLLAVNQQLYLSVDNLFDKVYMASRAHGGIQPGKYRTLQMGYTYRF
jgi:Fe(3+) dicitrate transport protein